MGQLYYKYILSPIGQLKLVASHEKLFAILWDNERPNRVKLAEMQEAGNNLLLLQTESQLDEYFRGGRSQFDIPMQMKGTAFQQAVWHTLMKIPYGITRTYKEIAEAVGRPYAVRAVGTAIGRNPISIIVPCHRVIASNGGLAGFAGGLDRKQLLLHLEKGR